MKKIFKIISLVVLFAVITYSCSSDFAYNDVNVRFIQSTINQAKKSSIILQNVIIWGFGHFSINTPGDRIIITYYESSVAGTAYLNGVAKSVSYLGTTYSGGGSINDIMQYNEGRFKFITQIDTSGTFVSLDDNTNWIVRPDLRANAKKWKKDDKVILDNGKNFIANPRLNEIIIVKEIK